VKIAAGSRKVEVRRKKATGKRRREGSRVQGKEE
jgi:hypothetical protein